jgi:hypothetical protein
MKFPSAAELLALWERGVAQHPIDRALLLAGWVGPEQQRDRLADLPLGTVNRALLRLREAWFGDSIRAYWDCERCGQRLELALETGELLRLAAPDEAAAQVELAGFRFRPPCSRDLAAIAWETDLETAASQLLERCCLGSPTGMPAEFSGLLAEIEAALEELDPAADISLSLSCEACGYRWIAGFDIGTVLWDEVDARAGALLTEVDALARAYGWTESQILALSARRRASYLAMIGA